MKTNQQSRAGCIAVFDVGKTNKKVLIYDSDLNIVDSVYAQFDEAAEGSEKHERIVETAEWFLSSMSDMARRHSIQAISVSAHGATFVCIDEKGELALPVLSYTTDPGDDFHNNFAMRFGDPLVIQQQTFTPSIPG